MAGSIPVVIINEPMFISQGKNSDIRYNFYYPRWAYDDYREMMTEKSIKISLALSGFLECQPSL